MAEIYGVFLFALVVIAIVGGGAARVNIAPLALAQVGILARVVASITAAGLLSLAFVIDKLASAEIDLVEFFRDSTSRDALAMVMWLLAAGASGLLATLVLALYAPVPEATPSLASPRIPLLKRWAAGCLAVATAGVVLLFPATIALILIAGDAVRTL